MLFYFLYIHSVFAWIVIIQDLNLDTFDLTNWSTMDSSLEIKQVTNCNKQLLQIYEGQQIQRFVSIMNQDVTQLRIEADLYFLHFTDSEITIKVNGVVVWDQVFQLPSIQLYENLCEDPIGSHYFTLLDVITYFEIQNNNIIQIQYKQIIFNENSFFGLRNLILYTNGVAINCPTSMPISSITSQCTSFCDDGQQLKLPPLTSCYSGSLTTNSKIIKTYPDELDESIVDELTADIWQISDEYSWIDENGAQVILSDYIDFSAGSLRLIIQGIIYLFGDWDDGSYLRFQLNGTYVNSDSSISTEFQEETSQIEEKTRYFEKYSNGQRNITKIFCDTSQCYKNQLNQTVVNFEFLTINKTNGKFQVNPTNLFEAYESHLILSDGSRIPVTKVILNSEAQVYQASGIQEYLFTIRQKLEGEKAQFAIQNKIFMYQASKSDALCRLALATSCYSCFSPYYAYLGKCIINCPIYSYVSIKDRNCTDLVNIETLQYTEGITQNSSGMYLIKEFYDSLFVTSSIEAVFDDYPTLDNYFNGQKYSNLNNGKIVGGFSSWGYGSYVRKFVNLPYHYQIRIYSRLYFIDKWSTTDTFIIQIDENKYQYTINELLGQQIQGKEELDYYQDIFIRQAHYNQNLKIQFTCLGDQYNDSREKSCGLSNLFVLYDRNVNYLCPQQNEFYQQYIQTCYPCLKSPDGCIQYQSQYFYKCDYHCFTCAQTPKNCLSCDPALRREFDVTNNWCNCIEGYYELQNQPQCKKCPTQCITCDSGQCYTCSKNSQLIDGYCQCLNNYSEVNGVCCNKICGSCDSNEKCLSCLSEDRMVDNNGDCVCKVGYIEQETSLCQKIVCNQSCATCFGESKQNCLTCEEETISFRILSNNQCQCLDGYSEDEQGNCKLNLKCYPTCATCFGEYKDNCLTCEDQNIVFRVLQNNQCNCLKGYQEDQNGNCKLDIQCHPTCATCFGESKQNCLTCLVQNIAYRTLISNQCVCIEGYTENEDGICQPVMQCNPTCATCFGEAKNNCLSCGDTLSSFRYFNDNQCLCIEGYYEDENESCSLIKNCFYTCNKCKEDNNQFMCLDCQQFRELTAKNQCECIIGYKELQNQCIDQNTFDEYIYLSNQCDDGNNLPRDGCYLYSIEPFWYCSKQTLNELSKCGQCPSYCLNCVSSQKCTLCQDGYFLFGDICLKCSIQCQTCQNNQNNCLNCSDQSQQPINQNCQSCSYGYYLIDKTCQSICGDAILVGNEQCDDGNQNDLDGCNHNCLIESSYLCQETSCIPKPIPTKSIQYQSNQLSLGFNNIISKCNYITIWIEQLDSNLYSYNISQIISNQYDLECAINFTFFSDINSNNIIHALLQKNARMLAQYDEIEVLITPQKQYYFTDVQKENSLIIYYLYQLLLYVVLGLFPLSLMFKQYNNLDLEFLIQTSYLYYFDLDLSLYLQQFLVLSPLKLIPFFDYPFTIQNQLYFSNKRSITRIEDQYIISNLWTLIIIILPLLVAKQIFKKIKRSQQIQAFTQVRPTTSKNTKNTQFTFREEQVNQSKQKNQEFLRIKRTTDYQIQIHQILNYLVNQFSITVFFSIIIQLIFISQVDGNEIYYICNILLLVITIGLIGQQFSKLTIYYSLKNVKFSYCFVSQIITILFILTFLLFRSQQIYVICLCCLLQLTKVGFLGYNYQIYKVKDICQLLQLIGICRIAYIQTINLWIEFSIIGLTSLYAIVNIFAVVYQILKQYL